MHVLKRAPTQVHPPFKIIDKGGVGELLSALSGEIKAPGREVLGIVLDANNDPGARWKSVSDRLKKADVVLPEAPERAGVVLPGEPRVGVWLMPDNQSAGQLEDFVTTMIPANDPVWPLAQGYIGGIPKEHRQFTTAKTSRAELHAWLASRKEPGFMGQAVRRGDLDVEGPLCRRFATWIMTLYGEH